MGGDDCLYDIWIELGAEFLLSEIAQVEPSFKYFC